MRELSNAATVADYLQALPEAERTTLENLRQLIKAAAPQAEEMISYQIPTFKYLGPLVYYAAYKNHCSLFVASNQISALFREELKNFKTAGATIQFTTGQPLPATLVQKIVQARVQENIDKDAARKMARKAKKSVIK